MDQRALMLSCLGTERTGRSLLQAACNKTCLNGGQCYLDEKRGGQAQCSCPNEFYGSRCERSTSIVLRRSKGEIRASLVCSLVNGPKSCLPKNPCMNNAKCVSTTAGSKCICTKGTSGVLCEKRTLTSLHWMRSKVPLFRSRSEPNGQEKLLSIGLSSRRHVRVRSVNASMPLPEESNRSSVRVEYVPPSPSSRYQLHRFVQARQNDDPMLLPRSLN